LDLDTDRRRNGLSASNQLARDRVDGALNLDVPLLKDSPIGRLSANANAEAEHLSDFGTLATVGAGLNWSPAERLDLIASWTREEGAPSVRQLGDAILDTPDTRVFDFTTGETVLVTAITGGNPNLDSDRRNVFKLGANWKPFEDKDLRLRADYVHSTIQDPVASFPGPSAALEAAFPDRFVRDGIGKLVAVDRRPVNFEESRRDTLRWGFDFSKPLKSARPRPGQNAQTRARVAAARGGAWPRRRGRRPRRGLLRRRAESGAPAVFADAHHQPGRRIGDRSGDHARLSARRCRQQFRRTVTAPGRVPIGLVEQRPRRAPVRQLAQRHPGRRRHQRRSALFGCRDVRPAPVRQFGRAFRPGREASLADRQLPAARRRQSARREARSARRRRGAALPPPTRTR